MAEQGRYRRKKQTASTYELLIGTTAMWRGRHPVAAVNRLIKRHPKATITIRCPQPQGLLVACETV